MKTLDHETLVNIVEGVLTRYETLSCKINNPVEWQQGSFTYIEGKASKTIYCMIYDYANEAYAVQPYYARGTGLGRYEWAYFGAKFAEPAFSEDLINATRAICEICEKIELLKADKPAPEYAWQQEERK